MRIVAGEYSSRKIEAPKGNTTRPTLDKVREAVFSSLGGFFAGGVFLDLYAGSGANGLEAISRGFDQAVFVDVSRDAVNVIRRNIASLGCQDKCRVLPMRADKALHLLKEEGITFDLVYLDPPYARQENARVIRWLEESNMMNPDGRIVIESLKEDSFAQDFGHIKYYKEAVYGISRITYLKNEGDQK